MNLFQNFQNFISQGGTPQKFLNDLLNGGLPQNLMKKVIPITKNPIVENILKSANEGKVKIVENIARNVCKNVIHIDFDTEYANFLNKFNIR